MSAPNLFDRKQLRAARRVQKRALKKRIQAQMRELRKQPVVAQALAQRRRKRQRRIATVLAIILALLLLDLDCEGGPGQPGPVTIPAIDVPEPPKKKKPVRKKKKAKLEGKVDKNPRAPMDLAPTDTPPWLNQFRMQVAARSPRLATCFIGTERPGALRWSALVNPRNGLVTESVVEPVFRGVELTSKQQACLVSGLTEKPYKLDEPEPQPVSRRVSLIFEF